MRAPDRTDRLQAYRATHGAWIDQAILLLQGCPVASLPAHLAQVLAAAYAAGKAQATAPTPVDWKAHRHDRYVRPCYGIMATAGQKIAPIRVVPPPPVGPPYYGPTTASAPPIPRAPMRRILRKKP